MGWNFVVGLSKCHEVHVISEALKWERPINEYLEKHPELNDSLKFYFITKKRAKTLRKIWPPSYYWFYGKWQKKAFDLALELDQKENFDLIHQLNMVGYREPGYLWKLKKPFVWGPIGGLENSPWQFLPSLGLNGLIFYSARNLINSFQRRFLSRPQKAAKRKNSKLIAATTGNALLIRNLWKQDPIVIPEVGGENLDSLNFSIRSKEMPFRIVWSGLHIPRKNLPLLLNALKSASFPFELFILGVGTKTSSWRTLAEKTGIKDHCNWMGWLERSSALDVFKQGHVFCITSISDLTSTVTLEALSAGLPIICLDHFGFSDVVTPECGIKIPVTNPKLAAHGFREALEEMYNNEDQRQIMARNAIARAKEFSWERKIDSLNTIYEELLYKRAQ